MDYSIYDAIRAGFGKVVFIIRKDFADNFKKLFAADLEGKIDVDYVYQEMDSFVPPGIDPSTRQKPWGTAHAVLCAKEVIKEPFAVINADDFYGQDAFKKAADFLNNQCSHDLQALVGYELIKTLSEHGTVSRGVCKVDEEGNLVSIREMTKVAKEGEKIFDKSGDAPEEIPVASKVSMNFWCFHPSIFNITENLFVQFAKQNKDNPKAEFFIPIVADEFIRSGKGKIIVIPTSSQWFGVTYKEDAPVVKKSLDELVDNKEYPGKLWENEKSFKVEAP